MKQRNFLDGSVMHNPPVFQRSPRIIPDLPQGEIEIPAPPTQPSPPSNSVMLVLLPIVLAAGALAAVGYLTHMGAMLWFSIPMMLVSGVASVATHLFQKRKTKEEIKKRKEEYSKLLKDYGERLEKLRVSQQRIMLSNDPSPEECLTRVSTLDRNLWAREPGDKDFLSVRVGIGSGDLSVSVKAPRVSNQLEPDPLVVSAQKLADSFRTVTDVPLCLPLSKEEVSGVAGERSRVLGLTRAMIIQLATYHSPTEVKLAVLYPSEEEKDWKWVRWIPHVWGEDGKMRFVARDRAGAHRIFEGLEDFLTKRERKFKEYYRSSREVKYPLYLVVVIADRSLVEEEFFVHRLITEGPKYGVFPLFLAERVRALPRECKAWARLGKEEGFLTFTEPRKVSYHFKPDIVPTKLAGEFARVIAPIQIKSGASRKIPRMISLLELFGTGDVEKLQVASRWHNSAHATKSLAVPIGAKEGGEPLYLDLHERAHGPNGLVAGMVGAGKSELLQTLVASLAINFHPHRVSFVLVDYKGGGMADPFTKLPHTLGVITNLQKGNLAARAITSFKVEMERRQKLFKSAGVNHIDQYQRLYYQGKVETPMPYLVIIVDEFAEMKTEQPDVAKEFVRVARLGRALGFRLILAMQKPAGIVDGQIEANTRFRLCLKVAQTEDSQAMLKRPDAAFLIGTGRAYFQVGANEVFEEFQVAWSGAPYDPTEAAHNPLEIVEVSLGGERKTLYNPASTGKEEDGVTQLKAVVAHLREVAEAEKIEPLEGLWLPPLPSYIPLEAIRSKEEGWNGESWNPTKTWVSPVIGVLDDPQSRFQGPLRLNLSKEGHALVFGAPGYGKTVLVETIITSLVLSHPPSDVNFYILDFGGRLLKIFEPLPHGGGVITPDEKERVSRLWKFLSREMEKRKKLFGDAGVTRLKDYREVTGTSSLPAIVVIIENYANFYKTYEEQQQYVEQIAREGGNLGIHLVITANSSTSVRFSVRSLITMALALSLADVGEYSDIVGRTGGLVPDPIPGRGLVKGKPPLEFQGAVPIDRDTDAERTKALREMISKMAVAWKGPVAHPIRVLPKVVLLSDLMSPIQTAETNAPPCVNLTVPLGLYVEELDPLTIDLSNTAGALILGRPKGGKTTLLQTWLIALANVFSPDCMNFYLLDSRRKDLAPLARLPHVQAYSSEPSRSEEIVKGLTQSFHSNENSIHKPKFTIVAVDGMWSEHSGYVSDTFEENLAELVLSGEERGLRLLLTSNNGDFKKWSPLAKALIGASDTFLIGHSEDSVVELNIPYGKKNKTLPPGEGYLQRGMQALHIKIATVQTSESGMEKWIKSAVSRFSRQTAEA